MESAKSESNLEVIKSYLKAMKTEINLDRDYEIGIKITLTNLSKFHGNKSFSRIKREDIITFLDSFRKPEKIDPLHKWIGTYNLSPS